MRTHASVMARLLPLLLGAALWTACDEAGDDDDTTEEPADDDATPVLDDPAVTAVSPSSGPPEGGYPANVYGTYFTTADDMQITFGERVATIQECATPPAP